MDWRKSWLGISLIVLGAFLLLIQFDLVTFGWRTFWPMIILLPGLVLEVAFLFNRGIPGILVPGGILTVTGLNLFLCNTFGWGLMAYLWPLFPLSVAFGLFQLYVFDTRDQALLIPVTILGGFSAVSFISILATHFIGKIIPFVIIGIGIYVYWLGRRPIRKKEL